MAQLLGFQYSPIEKHSFSSEWRAQRREQFFSDAASRKCTGAALTSPSLRLASLDHVAHQRMRRQRRRAIGAASGEPLTAEQWLALS